MNARFFCGIAAGSSGMTGASSGNSVSERRLPANHSRPVIAYKKRFMVISISFGEARRRYLLLVTCYSLHHGFFIYCQRS